jgi:hypothetical protein
VAAFASSAHSSPAAECEARPEDRLITAQVCEGDNSDYFSFKLSISHRENQNLQLFDKKSWAAHVLSILRGVSTAPKLQKERPRPDEHRLMSGPILLVLQLYAAVWYLQDDFIEDLRLGLRSRSASESCDLEANDDSIEK